MGEQKPEKTKKHICAGLLAHVEGSNATGSSGNHCNFRDGTYFCME